MEASKSNRHDIFISFSDCDENFVEQLCEDLELANQHPFCRMNSDVRMKGSENPIEVVFQAANSCDLAIVVLSEEYFSRSEWPMIELSEIVNSVIRSGKMKKILPLYFGLTRQSTLDPERRERWFSRWKKWAAEDSRISLDEWKFALVELGRRVGMFYFREKRELFYRREIVSSVCEIMQQIQQAKLPDFRQELYSHFFGNQCRLLGEQISIAKEILSKEASPYDDSSGQTLWPQTALPELLRVVKLGRTLIECCENEPCQKAYLRQGERAKAFEEMLKEVIWCISVVFYYNKRYLSGNPSIVMDEFPQAELGAKEKYVLQKAALSDEKVLQASLDKWIESHACSAEECGSPGKQGGDTLCLAAQILDRRHVKDAACAAPRGLDDHSSVLWITDKDVLKDGRKIGKGSFGTVTETKWLGDKYAKKEFQVVLKFFKDEASALAKLDHPHIVKVSACNVGCVPCFFLMEIMPHDLRSYMNVRTSSLQTNPPFSISAGIDLMLQLSEAMSYVSSKGMVHRDLKAENILVKPVDEKDFRDGFVVAKLADFGLAKSKHEVTAAYNTANQGTRLWMAPELFAAYEKDPERLLVHFPHKADVYSFGIVCSEILTGKMPYHNVRIDYKRFYSQVSDRKHPLRPELPENCPEILASLIRDCWHTKPSGRPTFEEISTTLRDLKGLLMLGGEAELAHFKGAGWRTLRRQLGAPFRTHMVQTQGPFGVDSAGPYTYYDGPSTGVWAFKIFVLDQKTGGISDGIVSGFQVQYDLNGQLFTGGKHGCSDPNASDWVKFDYPREYLIQVEGSSSAKEKCYAESSSQGSLRGSVVGTCITSLTFITNKATYGPYGRVFDPNTAFCSERARVVGFFGVDGDLLESVGVLTVPDPTAMFRSPVNG